MIGRPHRRRTSAPGPVDRGREGERSRNRRSRSPSPARSSISAAASVDFPAPLGLSIATTQGRSRQAGRQGRPDAPRHEGRRAPPVRRRCHAAARPAAGRRCRCRNDLRPTPERAAAADSTGRRVVELTRSPRPSLSGRDEGFRGGGLQRQLKWLRTPGPVNGQHRLKRRLTARSRARSSPPVRRQRHPGARRWLPCRWTGPPADPRSLRPLSPPGGSSRAKVAGRLISVPVRR